MAFKEKREGPSVDHEVPHSIAKKAKSSDRGPSLEAEENYKFEGRKDCEALDGDALVDVATETKEVKVLSRPKKAAKELGEVQAIRGNKNKITPVRSMEQKDGYIEWEAKDAYSLQRTSLQGSNSQLGPTLNNSLCDSI